MIKWNIIITIINIFFSVFCGSPRDVVGGSYYPYCGYCDTGWWFIRT